MNDIRLEQLHQRAASGLRSHEATELLAAYDALAEQVAELTRQVAEVEEWRQEYRTQTESLQETCDDMSAETLEAFTVADDWMSLAKLVTTERNTAHARAERAETEARRYRAALNQQVADFNTAYEVQNVEIGHLRAEAARYRTALEEIANYPEPQRLHDAIIYAGRSFFVLLKTARTALEAQPEQDAAND